ncbi:unnamed protein product [Sphagnum tenellum]
MQVKGKAAIHVVLNPLGKSGGAAWSLDAQFTPLVQKDLKGKLLEGKLSAISVVVLGQFKARKEVTYRFVNVLNEQGFIEGRYVLAIDGQAMVAIAPAPMASTTNGDGSTEKQGEGQHDIPASKAAPIN